MKSVVKLSSLFSLVAPIATLCLPTAGLAVTLAGANTVNSAAIIDGAVATIDIANAAVTGAKIAAGTITGANLASGAVNSGAIAAGAVGSTALADKAVTAAKLGMVCSSGQTLIYSGGSWVCGVGPQGPQGLQGIQGLQGAQGAQGAQGIKGATGETGAQGLQGPQGAVGPQGAQGIQGVKGDTGVTGAQGVTGPQGPAARYGNVIVVAKSGGDFTDPIAAVGSISDASATNPYLIKIMPGVYDLGTSSLHLKAFVDIEGSGTHSTTILSVPDADPVVSCDNDAQITNLSIENGQLIRSGHTHVALGYYFAPSGTSLKLNNLVLKLDESPANGTALDVYSQGGVSVDIRNVDVIFAGSPGVGVGISLNNAANLQNVSINNGYVGIVAVQQGATAYNVIMDNFKVSGTPQPLFNGNGVNMLVKNSYLHSDFTGTTTNQGSLKIFNSILNGVSISNQGAISVASTQVDSSSSIANSGSSATSKCFNVYDVNLNPVSCQ